MKNFVHFLSYIILRLTCTFLSILPLSLSYTLARLIGNLAYHILHYRRQVTMENLRIALGRDINETQLEKIASESYRQIAMSFVELLIAPKLQIKIRNILQPEHVALFRKLLDRGKGLVVVSGHLGNWEITGAASATTMPEPFTVAAVQQSNHYINRFITRRRSEMGMQVAGTKEAMKLLIRALKNRQAIGLVADQNAGPFAVFVEFFGKTAATQPGPAKLALKFKAPLLVCAAVRTGPGQFKVLIQEVEIKTDDTVESLTQRHVKVLENFIRQYPEQYFWIHRRWKTRPSWETLEKNGAGN